MGTALFQLLLNALLPSTWRSINMVILLTTLMIMMRGDSSAVWFSFVCNFILELYSVTPFGILLFSGTASALLSLSMFRSLFTNRSWYSASALSFCAIVFDRAWYTFLLIFIAMRQQRAFTAWQILLRAYASEILLTACATALLYALMTAKRRKQDHVHLIPYGA